MSFRMTQKEFVEERTPFVENCKGDENMQVMDPYDRLAVDGIPECEHMVDGFCNAYLSPEIKWSRDKICQLSPLATAKVIASLTDKKMNANPLKMSKRGIKQ